MASKTISIHKHCIYGSSAQAKRYMEACLTQRVRMRIHCTDASGRVASTVLVHKLYLACAFHKLSGSLFSDLQSCLLSRGCSSQEMNGIKTRILLFKKRVHRQMRKKCSAFRRRVSSAVKRIFTILRLRLKLSKLLTIH